MLDPLCWGGGVEIDIFSRIYRSQITVLDVSNRTEQVFGYGEGAPKRGAEAGINAGEVGCPRPKPQPRYRTRVFLLFVGGNHYDFLAWDQGTTHKKSVSLFSAYDEAAVRRARRAAATLAGSDQWYIDGQLKSVTVLRQASWADV
jgi:hypothetical protein